MRLLTLVVLVACAFTLSAHRLNSTPQPSEEPTIIVVETQCTLNHWATKYGISYQMAKKIDDWAVETQIPSTIAFSLVRVESNFNPDAVSNKGALGLTQVMPATAMMVDGDVDTAAELLDPDTNLRVGFTHLRMLIDHYDGNVWLALTAYYRGISGTDQLVASAHPRVSGAFQEEYAYSVLSDLK